MYDDEDSRIEILDIESKINIFRNHKSKGLLTQMSNRLPSKGFIASGNEKTALPKTLGGFDYAFLQQMLNLGLNIILFHYRYMNNGRKIQFFFIPPDSITKNLKTL